MGFRELVYGVYERPLDTQIPLDGDHRHVCVVLDGNRGWANTQRLAKVTNAVINVEHIAEHLRTKGQPGPDLYSGKQFEQPQNVIEVTTFQ